MQLQANSFASLLSYFQFHQFLSHFTFLVPTGDRPIGQPPSNREERETERRERRERERRRRRTTEAKNSTSEF